MAQVKTRPSAGRTKAKRQTSAKRQASTKARKANRASKPRATSKPAATASRRNGSSGNGAVQAVRKAKTPLIASGAAVAGAAGGLALGVRQARKSHLMSRPKVKIDSHDLAKAAKSMGRFGMEVGELASELRKNREETDSAKKRSPVEVVLDGLTHRG
jgi:thiamine pyrophosphate-dependent acetolactate synthase large subunit-like protein